MGRVERLIRLEEGALRARRRAMELCDRVQAAYEEKWRCEHAAEDLRRDLISRQDERLLRGLPGGDLAH